MALGALHPVLTTLDPVVASEHTVPSQSCPAPRSPGNPPTHPGSPCSASMADPERWPPRTQTSIPHQSLPGHLHSLRGTHPNPRLPPTACSIGRQMGPPARRPSSAPRVRHNLDSYLSCLKSDFPANTVALKTRSRTQPRLTSSAAATLVWPRLLTAPTSHTCHLPHTARPFPSWWPVRAAPPIKRSISTAHWALCDPPLSLLTAPPFFCPSHWASCYFSQHARQEATSGPLHQLLHFLCRPPPTPTGRSVPWGQRDFNNLAYWPRTQDRTWHQSPHVTGSANEEPSSVKEGTSQSSSRFYLILTNRLLYQILGGNVSAAKEFEHTGLLQLRKTSSGWAKWQHLAKTRGQAGGWPLQSPFLPTGPTNPAPSSASPGP